MKPTSPILATCGSRHAVGPDVVVTVGSNALLFLSRGYADPAPQARPAPRFDATRGISRGMVRDAQFANCASAGIVSYRPASTRRQLTIALLA
jgi:hypothetical protein